MAEFGPQRPPEQAPDPPKQKPYSQHDIAAIVAEFTSESTPVTAAAAASADLGQKAGPGQDQLRCPYWKSGCKYVHVTHAARCSEHGVSLV